MPYKYGNGQVISCPSAYIYESLSPFLLLRVLLISSAEKNNIVFTGFLPDEELKQLLASAKILVQPSLYEGFGIPPLQALYSGTKAVISDIPVFKEIYADLPVCFFKTGSVDDLAQKLTSVYFDDAPLPNFKKTYSYKNTANKILNSILEDIRG